MIHVCDPCSCYVGPKTLLDTNHNRGLGLVGKYASLATNVGRISEVNPTAFMNPSWILTLDVTEEDIESNIMIDMLYILAHEQIISVDEASNLLNVQNRRTGLYTMTPFAYSQLLYNKGHFGSMDIDDGYLSKVAFASTPEIARVNSFRIRGDVSSDSRDYREIILMAATWFAGKQALEKIK